MLKRTQENAVGKIPRGSQPISIFGNINSHKLSVPKYL